MNTIPTTSATPVKPLLNPTVSEAAELKNRNAVAEFFRMHGDETPIVYSDVLLKLQQLLMTEEYNFNTFGEERLQDMLYLIGELNTLVLKLNDPIVWVASDAN